ncbi:zinc finger and BTB domain-containing protein 14-like [Centruroides sculpturatus]|uniref:zinc finger and BTB domain-containing protein 14-like n=1 Tax=Centruroides sculpturatus TaxID=218467 RepID=UPI000C6D00B4|nr:zinc finger and BTB domain-containing protein 14-like [Centruroides sculpturatus]
MEIKEELDTKDFNFTFEPSKENFAVVLKNCKKELKTEDKKFCVRIKSEPLEYENDNNTEINTYENLRNNTNSFNPWSNSGYTSEIDIKKEVKENCDVKHGIKSECKVDLKKLKIEVKTEDCKEVVHLPDDNEQVMPVSKEYFTLNENFNKDEMNIQNIKKEEVKENYDIKQGIKSECKVVLKKLKFEVKREDCKEVVHLPDDNEKINIKREPIPTNNTNGSTIWSHSGYKIERDIKKEEIKENCDVKHGIKSECKLDFKKLKIEVKTEDYKEVFHLPDDDENVLPVNNEYFTPNENFNKNETNIKIEQEEEIKKYNIQQNSEIEKQFKYNIKTKSYLTSSRKCNKIHDKIKRKYFKVMIASDSKQEFMCELCKQTFTNKRILETHLFCHIRKKPFCCTSCNEKFLWQFLLRRHMKEHKTGNENEISHMNLRLQLSGNRVKLFSRNDKVHACKISGKEYKYEDRPIKSDIYNKNFKRKKQLKSYKKTYSEKRPFKCDICNKGFKSKLHLKSHHLKHSEERTFKCDICNKGFKWKGQLKSHHLTHSEERTFKCDIYSFLVMFVKRNLRLEFQTHQKSNHMPNRYLLMFYNTVTNTCN